jgi:hypothetical protein
VSKVSEDTILLFYAGHRDGVDRFVPFDRYLQKLVKPAYKRLAGKPATTGFEVWFRSLVAALELAGHRVVVNDRRAARANPEHPVGLAGFPGVLDGWDLPNPAVLGPGLYDHPSQHPTLMTDPRFVHYLTTCEWVDAMFRPVYGEACVPWFGGIDTEKWPDRTSHPKRYDILVYDKIRWNRDELEPSLLHPILAELDRRELRYHVLRYGNYHHRNYRDLLMQSHSMIFLCEHETQGMAYQEALASGLPVLAWEPGVWLDPRRPEYTDEIVPATSVPYFSSECGERFRDLDEFRTQFELFLTRMGDYAPRAFVERELSLERSAALYLTYYRSAAEASPGR